MADQVTSGTVSWVDLSTPDIEDARSFYHDLFGWDLTMSSVEMGEYFTATAGGREVAGMMAQDPDAAGQPAMWTVFIWVDDIDTATSAVSTADGNVLVPPFDIPGGAKVSVVADPAGAMFALIAGGPEPGTYFSATSGGVGWAELMTRQPDQSATFYRSVFGWESSTDDAGGMPYTVFTLDGTEVAGMIETPAHLPPEVPPTWSVYFVVPDCRVAEERVVELDGHVLLSATPTPMGPFAVVSDRQGAVFQVVEFATS